MGGTLADRAGGGDTEEGTLVDLDAARFIQRNGGPRGAIGHKRLANSQVYWTRLLTNGMPSNARCAFQTSDSPRWPGIPRGFCAQNKKHRGCKQNDRRDSAKLIGPPQTEKAPVLFHRANVCNLLERRRGLILPVAAQRRFQFLNFRVRLSGAVPQIIVLHRLFLLAHVALNPWLSAALSSFSRKSRMPRKRLTRTEPCVSPVRSAISGPVIPSTSRRMSGSR